MKFTDKEVDFLASKECDRIVFYSKKKRLLEMPFSITTETLRVERDAQLATAAAYIMHKEPALARKLGIRKVKNENKV